MMWMATRVEKARDRIHERLQQRQQQETVCVNGDEAVVDTACWRLQLLHQTRSWEVWESGWDTA